MARWHAESCKSPRVVFGDSSTPRCETCGASASKYLAGLKEQASDPLPPLPPDEPLGQLKLSWPPSIQWTWDVNDVSWALDWDSLVQSEMNSDKQRSPPTTEASHPESSFIYGSTLGTDCFRLICLESPSKDVPPGVVHLTLETYPGDRYPEYETVSYVWGGEDGNRSLQCPIYIGDYWDILLQTQNCFAMLQYLVPQRGIRMVWVDAICINQTSLTERADQVNKMGQIYSQCSQVVLWLGTDVVNPCTGAHPQRHHFQELIEDKAVGERYQIKQLLKRQYFRRVWVIQELLLALRVVIPIRDAIFWADARTGSSLSQNDPGSSAWSWEHTEAPWLRHISQGTVTSERFMQFMSLVRKSQASDPRDRILGLFGLLPAGEAPRPDYGLSFQHIFIGFVAHTILNLHDTSMLHHAAGAAAPDLMPSWLPDWRRNDAWNHIFDMQDQVGMEWEAMSVVVRPIQEEWKRQNYPRIIRPVSGIIAIAEREYRPASPISLGNKPKRRSEITGQPEIDCNTGALSIDLRRITAIHHVPTCAGRNAYTFEGRGGFYQLPRYLCLISCYPLDKTVKPGDEIWAWDDSPGHATFVILRRVAGPSSFRLIATCRHLVLSTKDSKLESLMSIEELHDGLHGYLQRVSPASRHEVTPRPDFEMLFADTQPFLFRDMVPFAMRNAEELNFHPGAFPASWEDLYLDLVNPKYRPRIDGDWCYITIPEEKHEHVARLTVQATQGVVVDIGPWIADEPEDEPKATSTFSPGSDLVLRRRLDSIESDLRRLFENYRELGSYLQDCLVVLWRLDPKDGPSLLMSYVQGEDDPDVAVNSRRLQEDLWGDTFHSICRGFSLDGGMYRISIL